jgi:putative tricarboxylic transport membrane protein
MAAITNAFISALEILLSWPTIIFVLVGTLIGITFGAVPGLGGVVALALLIPITFGMESTWAMVLFGSTLGGVAFGGSISAILINVPGTAPNAATLLDGFPMAKQGRAAEALGASATASALGAIFGLVVFVAIIPFARIIILSFTQPEFFWLAIFGLTVIAVVSRGNLFKGILAGGFGLMLSMIGYANVTSEVRYWFGIQYFYDGINLVVALIGLFALAEVLRMIAKGGTIAEAENISTNRSGVFKGIKEVIKRPKVFLRSCITGVLVGAVPGAGGTIATFISYMQIMQSSDDPESFGKGNIEGVIASEATNDAKDGGTLLPTVVFGIPGGSTTAVLLGAFTMHGLTPGQQMLNEDLHILFLIVLALLGSNILTSSIGLLTANHLSKLTKIKVERLVGPIIVVCFIGAYALRLNLIDIVIALLFGFIGYAMITFDYSRISLVLGLILGPIAEKSFHIALQISDSGPMIFFKNPISIILIILTVIAIVGPILRKQQRSDA